MIKNVIGILAIAAMMISCGTSTGDKKSDSPEAAVNIEFASLIETPTDFLDKDIVISGNVVHVCTHSGKKMYIVGENPDIRLFITAGEELPKFPMELLGSTITVTGHLAMVEAGEKMGEGEHAEGENVEKEEHSGVEAEHLEEAENVVKEETAEGEDCETEAAVAAQPVLSEYVLQYKSHVQK
jgi:hypothetical protein